MNVYIYPNNPSDDSNASEAKDAILSALQETAAHFKSKDENIDVNVEIDDSHPSVDEDYPVKYKYEKGAVLTDFGRWNTLNNDPNVGSHLLIVSSWDGGLSGGRLGGAWRNKPVAVAGQNSTSAGHFRNICIQEIYHLFISVGGPNSPDLPAGEHALGHVQNVESRSGVYQTPMVTSYLDEGLAKKGECASTGDNPGYTTTLSPCTLDATLTSYRNQGWF